MWTMQEYLSEVAREQVARPLVPVGRVHYDVLVRVAPAVAFAVTDSTPYNPCFHAERLDAFLGLVGQRLPSLTAVDTSVIHKGLPISVLFGQE